MAANPPTKLLLLSLLLVSSLRFSWCQRLSTGASDWYMRFHDFDDLVKRSVDRPVTRSFRVSSSVRHRFASTAVRTAVHNPAPVEQTFRFGFAMPAAALVSGVRLARDSDYEGASSRFNESGWKEGRYYHAGQRGRYFGGEEEMEEDEGGAEGQGWQNADGQLILDASASFKQFVLPIRILPGDNVTVELTYEELLERKEGRYEYSVSVSPGEIVRDFRLDLSVEERHPLRDLKVVAPVIGDLGDKVTFAAEDYSDYDYDLLQASPGVAHVSFGMEEVDQFDYFGRHGFTGDFSASYDVETLPDELDLIVAEDSFVHFYTVPDDQMDSIPRHAIFVLDDSESMSGPKSEHAAEVLSLLVSSLSDNDYVSVITFNNTVRMVQPPEDEVATGNETIAKKAFPVNQNSTADMVSLSVSGLGRSRCSSNLSLAVSEAMALDRDIWEAGNLPENAYTVVVLVTDGRSEASRPEKRRTVNRVREANRAARIPVFIVGVGFDADMDFLGEVADRAGGVAANVIEDLDVRPQLAPFRANLDEVVLKNLRLSYIGGAFDQDSLTNARFLAFRAGTSVTVAGRLILNDSSVPAQFEVEATGQSARGLFLDHPPTLALNGVARCDGVVTLCSEADLLGDCIDVSMSRSNLWEFGFGNRAASANVSGDCAWVVYSETYYGGESFILVPGSFPALPPPMHKAISSVRAQSLASFAPPPQPTVIEAVADSKDDTSAAKDDDGEVYKSSSSEEEEEEETGDKVDQGDEDDTKDADDKEKERGADSTGHVKVLLDRIRAFLVIKDVLRRLDLRPESVTWEEMDKATFLALGHGFLTPFTDLHLNRESQSIIVAEEEQEADVEPSSAWLSETSVVTYRDLSPSGLLFSLDDDPHIKRQWEALQQCRPPVACIGNFHFELLPKEEDVVTWDGQPLSNGGSGNCSSTLTLFTKPDFGGEFLEVTSSVHQLYHSSVSQRMRSLRAEGDCCWLLFDRRFFAGNVEKVCGPTYEQGLRLTNVGSAKRISPPPPPPTPATTQPPSLTERKEDGDTAAEDEGVAAEVLLPEESEEDASS